MERLTVRTSDGILVKEDYGKALRTLYQCFGAEPIPHYANCDEGYCAMEKLAEYEDLWEQGKILKLPCAEVYESSGDFVYYIFEDEIVKCINCGVQIEADGNIVFTLDANEKIFPYREPDSENDLSPEDWCEKTITLSVREWNKTVFLTQEAAEATLKEMEAKRNE